MYIHVYIQHKDLKCISQNSSPEISKLQVALPELHFRNLQIVKRDFKEM